MTQNKNNILIGTVLVTLAAIMKVVTFPHSINPIIAISLFSGGIIKDKKFAFAMPLLAMFMSDLMLEIFNVAPGFYGMGQIGNYFSLLFVTVLGLTMKKINPINVIGYSVDFIKTSTGKISPAATMPVTLVMLEAIRDFYYKTGKKIAMKPAGGISKAKLALHYLVMLNEVLGEEWMNNEWFRFGASSLANDILMQLMKQRTGVYQSADYFAND